MKNGHMCLGCKFDCLVPVFTLVSKLLIVAMFVSWLNEMLIFCENDCGNDSWQVLNLKWKADQTSEEWAKASTEWSWVLQGVKLCCHLILCLNADLCETFCSNFQNYKDVHDALSRFTGLDYSHGSWRSNLCEIISSGPCPYCLAYQSYNRRKYEVSGSETLTIWLLPMNANASEVCQNVWNTYLVCTYTFRTYTSFFASLLRIVHSPTGALFNIRVVWVENCLLFLKCI